MQKVIDYVTRLDEYGTDLRKVLDCLETHFPLPPIARDNVYAYEYTKTYRVLRALGSKKMRKDYSDEEIKEAISYIGLGCIRERGTVSVTYRIENSEQVTVDTHFHSLNLLLKELNSYVENGFVRIQKKFIARMDSKYCLLMGKRCISIMGKKYYLTPSRYETVKKLLK